MVTVAVLALTFSAGWWLASSFATPEQRAAAAQPPEPADITATVTRGELVRETTARGIVEPAHVWSIALTTDGTVTTITSIHATQGDELDAGDSPLSINGEPFVLLPGEFPFYRDVGPGDHGVDVQQLQAALDALGYDLDVTGEWDRPTQRALDEFFEGHGLTDRQALSSATTIVLPTFPVTLLSSHSVGDVLSDGQTLRLGSGDLVLRTPVPVGMSAQIRLGAPVSILGNNGEDGEGSVVAIARAMDDPDSANITIRLDDMSVAFVPGDVAVAVITLETLAEESLLVPSASIVSRSPGEAVVLKHVSDGVFVEIEVRELAQFGGTSAIEVRSGALSPGDSVKVG